MEQKSKKCLFKLAELTIQNLREEKGFKELITKDERK